MWADALYINQYNKDERQIGRRAFLHRQKVPETISPTCPCGKGDQIAAHLFCECTDEKFQGLRAIGYSTKEEMYNSLSHRETAVSMAPALAPSEWLPQFKVCNKLRQATKASADDAHAWPRHLPPLVFSRLFSSTFSSPSPPSFLSWLPALAQPPQRGKDTTGAI